MPKLCKGFGTGISAFRLVWRSWRGRISSSAGGERLFSSWAVKPPIPTRTTFCGLEQPIFAPIWRHSDYDGLIQGATRSTDQTERLRLYRQADRLLMEEAAIVPLVYRADHFLVKPGLKIDLYNYDLQDTILELH